MLKQPPTNAYTAISVMDFGLEAALEVLNRGFSDYIVPIQLDLAQFYGMLRVDGTDVSLSQIALQDGEGVSIALIARRGWNSRVAAMAVVPEARRQGVGRWLMEATIKAASQRGDRVLGLEVIEQNTPAVALYESLGFVKIRRLVSLKYTPRELERVQADLTEVDIRSVAAQVSCHGLTDLPWQASAESLAQAGPPQRAYQLGQAYVVLSPPEAETVQIRSLIVAREARHQGQASQLLRAIFAKFPGKTWQVPAIMPEEMQGVFIQLGFELQKLSQFQMKYAIL